MKTIIDIQEYADFDILVSKCIMFHVEHFSILDLKKEFCEKEQINDFENLPETKLRDYTEKFVDFLKDKDFKVLKVESVYFNV